MRLRPSILTSLLQVVPMEHGNPRLSILRVQPPADLQFRMATGSLRLWQQGWAKIRVRQIQPRCPIRLGSAKLDARDPSPSDWAQDDTVQLRIIGLSNWPAHAQLPICPDKRTGTRSRHSRIGTAYCTRADTRANAHPLDTASVEDSDRSPFCETAADRR